MFKPLLRVLPKLSGNVKLACNLTDLNKIGKTNRFDSHIRYARLLPLSSNLAQRKVEANLLTSSYEFDLSKYYKHYSNYFYSTTFEYNKVDYPILDKSSYQKNRDTDFEFGCKRISYEKNKYQFSFFAPIYIESNDDIPDYFLITIKLSNSLYHTEKQIKVNIRDDYKYNYLYIYLNKYSTTLDGKVIYCLPNLNQATYYGIDLKKGGFTKVVDDIIAKNYHYQKTINGFDANICNGFERNNIAIKQIIPLCFYFNINELLTKDELKKFSNTEAHITGVWYKDSKEVPFYNFDTNYDYLYEDVYSLDKKTGLFDWYSTGINLLDINYPSLNECKYINYRYSNKIEVPAYNRWKLKYSDDEHPYITNLSSAFSYNQKSIYKYGYFPEIFDIVSLITDKDNNAILPIGNSIEAKDSPYTNNYPLISKYYEILNSGVSNWYNIYSEINDSIFSDNIWKDLSDNKIFYNGILYDLTSLYDSDKDLEKIDKFSVLLNVHFNPIVKEELSEVKRASTTIYTSDKYMTDRNTFLTTGVLDSIYDSSVSFTNLQSLYKVSQSFNSGNAQLIYDNLYQQDDEGDFLDLLHSNFNIYDLNTYYKVEEIFNIYLQRGYSLEDIPSGISERYIEGLEFIPAHRLTNLLHENGKDILFEEKEDSEWILDNLYFSNKGNRFKTQYNKDVLDELIKDYNSSLNAVPVYIKQKFIPKKTILEYISNNTLNSLGLSEYEYSPTLKDIDGKSFTNNVFTKRDILGNRNYGEETTEALVKSTDTDFIYVDIFNLRKVIEKYNSTYRKGYPYKYNTTQQDTTFWNKSNSYLYSDFYSKFLNVNHLYWYVTDLYKNENNESTTHPYNSLYIKKRVVKNNPTTKHVDTKDLYIPIKLLYDNHRLLTDEEKRNILNSGRGNKKIFKKESNQYSLDSYREIQIFSNNQDYHEEDFYYIPEFYYKSYNNYIPLDEYIKSIAEVEDESVLRFINSTTISIIKNYDNSIIDIDYIDSYAVRKTFDSLNTDSTSLLNKETKANLEEALKLIKYYVSKIKDNIYYKDPISKNYVRYYYFTGENDFFNIDNRLMKALFNHEIDIDTYIINEKGKYVKKSINEDDYYTLVEENTEYMTKVVNEFLSDIEYHIEDNYYTLSSHYNDTHDLDKIVGILDLDGENFSNFSFEVVYKKTFLRMNKTLFDFINLTEDETYPYKDLYLYRLYKSDEYPSEIKYYYFNSNTSVLDSSIDEETLDKCLYPLFNDIYLEDKDYTVIYTDYRQSNIYPVLMKSGNSTKDELYRYNAGEIPYMLDISSIKENLPDSLNKYRYKEINNCDSSLTCMYDDLGLYDKYNLNTKVGEDGTIYSFILFDVTLDNTVMSFNIMNRRYVRNKYFITINNHDIYNNYDFNKVFNQLLPFMKINLISSLYNNVKFIVNPSTLSFNTQYKQVPLRKETGETYAYDILYHDKPLDSISLQRYFDAIVPLVKKENVIKDIYSLKYKDNNIPRVVSYTNDVFYSEDLNIWEYSPIRVYKEDNSYSKYYPTEYKYFNDNKFINLEESISIPVCKEETYDRILELERDEIVFSKFKTYLLNKKRVNYNDDEILFLINKYNIEYDSCCVGLNIEKTDKIYSLTYKFKLK